MDSSVQQVSDSERGATLVFVALTLLIVLVAAGLAVDLTSLERRGQQLQNAADAAALAGAAEWAQSGDQTSARQVIDDIIAQNGVGADASTLVTFLTASDVQVELTDDSPTSYLSGLVGVGTDVVRDATASLNSCSAPCGTIIDIPPPFEAFAAIGAGDGFEPIPVGNRFYAINHHQDRIVCMNRSTQAACWGTVDRPAHNVSAITDNVTHSIVADQRIWWLAQEANRLSLFCWELAVDAPCTSGHQIDWLESAAPYTSNIERAIRGGGLVEVGDFAYMFSDQMKVHCVRLENLATCPNFGSPGLDTALAGVLPPNDPTAGQGGWEMDRVLDPDTGRIWYTIHVNGLSTDPNVGTWIDCWDSSVDQPCTGWTPSKMFATPHGHAGRLFLHRLTDGTPKGVCATGPGDLVCVNFDGSPAPAFETELATLEAALPDASLYYRAHGTHFWHEASNRLFLTTPRHLSQILCWDFSLSASCGSLISYVPGVGYSQDYGFVAEGGCLYGLGHTSIFWSFTVDLEVGCSAASVTTELTPCTCDGFEEWGILDFSAIDKSQWDIFDIRIENLDGDLLLPDDGSDGYSLIDLPITEIDPDSIPTSVGTIVVRVFAQPKDFVDPWAGPVPPFYAIGRPAELILTE